MVCKDIGNYFKIKMNFLRQGVISSCVRRKTMDDISALIKEAKPLYFARKKRNNRIKAALCSLLLLLGIGSFYPKSEGYTMSYDYYLFGTEFSVSENSSVIEEMGLPVDEYGLLMVG